MPCLSISIADTITCPVLDLRTTSCRNVQRFLGGLVVKAHRLVYHSTLGSRAVKEKEERQASGSGVWRFRVYVLGCGGLVLSGW